MRAALTPDNLDDLLRGLARRVCTEVAMLLDSGTGPEGLPGWQLMEVDNEHRMTGRIIGGLHKEIDGFRLAGEH